MDNITLSPLKKEDLELLLAWRSHPSIYKHFKIQQKPLVWEEHYAWWQTRGDRKTFIVLFRDNNIWRKIGSVSLKHLKTNLPEIDIYIGELDLHGKGLGKKIIQKTVEWLKRKKYSQAVAVIHKDNIASQKIFTHVNFLKQPLSRSTKETWLRYIINM